VRPIKARSRSNARVTCVPSTATITSPAFSPHFSAELRSPDLGHDKRPVSLAGVRLADDAVGHPLDFLHAEQPRYDLYRFVDRDREADALAPPP